mgnify:CR=1 FL=1
MHGHICFNMSTLKMMSKQLEKLTTVSCRAIATVTVIGVNMRTTKRKKAAQKNAKR